MREEIAVGELAIRFLVESEESAGSVAVFEFDVPAGSKVAAAHSHDGYEETLYGLEGVLTWTIEGTAIDVGPGEALVIPRGAVHQFQNKGDLDASQLAALWDEAVHAHQERDLEGALERYAKVLDAMPRHASALYLTGVAHREAGRPSRQAA
jgi:quercetin dioxygenase-like cupin family protein